MIVCASPVLPANASANTSPNQVIGGTDSGAGNVISASNGNNGNAIIAGESGILVQGNLIGTNAGGTAALTPNQAGVDFFGGLGMVGVTIGGDARRE